MTDIDRLLDDVVLGFERYDFLDTRTMLAEAIDAEQVRLGIETSARPRGIAVDDLSPADLYLGCDRREDLLGRLCRVHWLAEISDRVSRLDGEDFTDVDDWRDVPPEVQEVLRAAALPQSLEDQSMGMLGSLVPLYRLMMEVIDVAYERDDVDEVLKCAHLMAEYGGLLVWEKRLGHAGLPARIDSRLRSADPAWNADGRRCPRRNDVEAVLKRSQDADRSDEALADYLGEGLSRVSSILLECGTAQPDVTRGRCKNPCGMAPSWKGSQDLGWRLDSVRRFQNSPIVDLRHPSPNGHGFRVPDKAQIDEAWTATMAKQILRPHYRAHRPKDSVGSGALRGLYCLVSYWAGEGEVLEPTTVLSDLRGRALEILRRGRMAGGDGADQWVLDVEVVVPPASHADSRGPYRIGS